MVLHVTALDKGGLSVYGQGRYDAHENLVVCDVQQDEVVDVTISFSTAPTEFDYFEDGIDGSEPVISTAGKTISVQFQTINCDGRYTLDAMFLSGAQRRIRFAANPNQPPVATSTTPTDDDDVDYGAWG